MQDADATSALVIDDNSGVRALYAAVCKQVGLAVVGVASIAEARAELHRWSPSVVILDVRLPDGSGLELVPDIRAAGDPPVIWATAATDQREVEVVAPYAFRILSKPFDILELQAAIETAVAHAQEQEHALQS